MKRIELLRKKAKENPKRIILPESEDKRVLKAAKKIANEGIARVILIGTGQGLEGVLKENSMPMDKIEIIDPSKDSDFDEISNIYYELRKHKGITPDEAREQVQKDPLYYGALLTRIGRADGFVAGASHTTPNVARAAIYCLKLDREVGIASSSFVIELENCPYGEDGLFIYGDCGVIPEPSSRQLAGIAISCSDLFTQLFDLKPRVALLSYSTKGSAKGNSVDKIIEALKRVKEKRPSLDIDGELQLDAAIVPEVAQIKCTQSPVAGKANVLIFPNLDAGNISYKLTQRLANARAVGPILQGITKPCSDLSRGCNVEDILDAVAVTVIRAQNITPKN